MLDKLNEIDELIDRLIKDINESIKYTQQDRYQLFRWGLYFSLIELTKEVIFLVKKERLVLIATACRQITELYLDVYNSFRYDNYTSRLLLTSIKKQKKYSEYVFKNQSSFTDAYLSKTNFNVRYAANEINKLEQRGIKPVTGIKEKFDLSDISDMPEYFWVIDQLNQEIHTDLRLLMDRYADPDKYAKSINKGYIKASRNHDFEKDSKHFVVVALAATLESTKIIKSNNKLTYNRAIDASINNLQKITVDIEGRMNKMNLKKKK